MTRIGIFELTSPPEGMVDTITATIAANAYPWERVQPYLTRAGIDAFTITWQRPDWMPNTTTGMWSAADNAIYLSTQFAGWQDDVPFVLTHEIGHMVDTACLTDAQRKRLMALMHNHPDWGVPPQVTHDSTEMRHDEIWSNGGAPYPAKVYECWADEFVAAFAPTVWGGTVTDAAPKHWPRFVHWSDDFAAVRQIALAEPATTKPPAKPMPKQPPTRRKSRRPRRHAGWFCRWRNRR